MTDTTDTQPQGDPAPVADAAPAAPVQPATNAPVDVEAIVTSRLSEWEEKRIKPLQTMLNEKNEEIKKLKTASMSEEQRAQLEIEERERRDQALELENWLLRKGRENSKAADFMEKFVSMEDPDEQWSLVASLFADPAPTSPEEPDDSTQVPDIDPNSPAPRVASGTPIGPEGQVLDKKYRETFLKGLTSWPDYQ